jgi:hypothetical protein
MNMNRRQFFTSVSVVGFASVAGCISSGSDTSVPTDDPEAVAKAYYNAMWSDDPATMEQLVHSEAEAAGESDMRARDLDKEVTGVETASKYTNVTIVYLRDTETPEPSRGLTVTLRKEDGGWKVIPGCVQGDLNESAVDPELCSPE